MKYITCSTLLVIILSPLICVAQPDTTKNSRTIPTRTLTADVVIAGGSTAALAAALASAEQGANTILIEPTDWIGGQFTSSGVPAVDEAWHKITDSESGKVTLNVAKIARDPRNMTPALRDILSNIGNPGRGWVSRFCFEPKTVLREHFEPWQERLSNKLVVLRDTVIKQVETADRHFIALTAIQRIPADSSDGYDRLPSLDLADWYSPTPSTRFEKQTIRVTGSVFVEATDWGELLALSGGDYLQGTDTSEGSLECLDTCGQSIVFGFVQQLHGNATEDPSPRVSIDGMGLGKYEGRSDAWEKIWTYRRIRGSKATPAPGDLSLQNWGYEPGPKNGGNDYPFGYLFLSKAETKATLGNWVGGVDVEVMRGAEQRALAWHQWFKDAAPPEIGADRITLATNVLGTGHGLCKLPYIRDTRRSIGLDDFVLKLDDLVGQQDAKTGVRFQDRVALGAYPADVHFLTTCKYPKHVTEHRDTKPFYIPMRALTHRDFDNLLVAGKTMAQSFMANSATRLHPIEWSSGTATGVIAAWMCKNASSSREAFEAVEDIRPEIEKYTPTEWTMD